MAETYKGWGRIPPKMHHWADAEEGKGGAIPMSPPCSMRRKAGGKER